MIFVGIDNGAEGGVAVITAYGACDVKPAPVQSTGKSGQTHDAHAMMKLLREAARRWEVMVWIEQPQLVPVSAMVKELVNGRWTGGYVREVRQPAKIAVARQYEMFGVWLGIIVTLGCKYESVGPRVWQRVMLANLPRKTREERKASAIRKAKQLFPGVNLRRTARCRKDHDGMADALLIAEFGKRCSAGVQR